MKKGKIEFAWHCHHDTLIEPLTNSYENRVNFIKRAKPQSEQALRLKLFKIVKGKLPSAYEKAGKAYAKAGETRAKAWEAYIKAGETRAKAWEAYNKVEETRAKGWEAWKKAEETRKKAWEAYNKAEEIRLSEVESLHRKECPDCPWDGKTIFSKKETK